jgi:hypothetical protein
MSPDVAQFLGNLLAAQTLQVGAPDFPETAALVQKAMVELSEVILLANDPELASEQRRLDVEATEKD